MKFIELHDETDTFWVNTDTIETIETETLTTRPQISSFIMLNGFGHYCRETPEEIFQKIAEATQSERTEIFQKFFEAEQRDTAPTGFMSEWAREVDEQLAKLTVRKDGGNEGDIV